MKPNSRSNTNADRPGQAVCRLLFRFRAHRRRGEAETLLKSGGEARRAFIAHRPGNLRHRPRRYLQERERARHAHIGEQGAETRALFGQTPPQRGFAAMQPPGQHGGRPIRRRIGRNQLADLVCEVEPLVHCKADAVVLQLGQKPVQRGFGGMARHI